MVSEGHVGGRRGSGIVSSADVYVFGSGQRGLRGG